ncbi:hypothetical protein EG329_006758 [Mollisiaceae sp. DMI_Dod_QoI]|nr:hypothetical protein EG329_006758 [Helotiales sp. DMI_Dod_QoI]
MTSDEKSFFYRDNPVPAFDTWESYVRGDCLFTNNAENLSRRLQEEKKKLFSQEEKMQVDVLNLSNCADGNGMQTRRRTIYDCSSLENYLSEWTDFHTRFISIAAPSSIRPLKVTEAGMYSIINHHNVGPQFLDLLLSFATGKNESEVGSGALVVKNHPDGSYEMQYRLSYSEEVGNNKNVRAIRQTGVYHRHVPNGSGNIWILLHPRPESVVQTRLDSCALEWERRNGSLDEWELTHILILSSYFGDWRWYIKSLSAEVERIACIALSYDFSTVENHGRGTDILQELHGLLNKILPISPRLRSTLATLSSLKTLYEILRGKKLYTEHHSIRILDELKAYETHTEGHLTSVALLEKRIQETVGLLAVALNLRGQSTALSINRLIFSLTKDTVDDSATSLLGMNLFTFQTSKGSGFQVSKQFWIFFLLTIPLTVITVGSWIFAARRRRKQKNRERKLQESVGEESEDM